MTATIAGVGFGLAVFLFVLVERLGQRVARLEGTIEQLVKRVNGRP